jgi:hypothetical protein
MIRIKPPKYEIELRKLCNCSNGKPRSSPWDSYHYPNCPYLKAMDEKEASEQ